MENEAIKGLTLYDGDLEVDDEEYWEKKLPDHYQRYIEMSDKPLNYTTKKELYFILCEGFRGDNGFSWFSLCKSSGEICCMRPATEVLLDDPHYERLERLSLSESNRFGEAMKLTDANWFLFTCILQSTMFSPFTSYACYLVCKFDDNHFLLDDNLIFGGDFLLNYYHKGYISSSILNVVYPTNIPTINPNQDLSIHRSMEQAEDGWKRVLLCKPRQIEDGMLLTINLKSSGFSGIIVAGIEFRPCMQ